MRGRKDLLEPRADVALTAEQFDRRFEDPLLGHSDVNLTVKRYGRWSSEAREQWDWIKKLDRPMDAVVKSP